VPTTQANPESSFLSVTLDETPEIFGDSLERVVSWKEGGDLAAIAGKPVRLRFVMKDADVFSFQFRD
jgi:hypothetical protein